MAADKKDPMQEKVSLHIPRMSGEDRSVFIGLNGKGWSIPRGVTVEVPKPVAEIYWASQANADAAEQYSDAKQRDSRIVHGAPDGAMI